MSTLAITGPRLADLPAAAVFAAATLAPTKPAGLAAVRIRPAAGGRVVIEALATTAACALEVEGEATRPLILPRWALLALRRRHGDAERLAVEQFGAGLRLLSLSDQAACAVACGEVADLPELPTWAPLQGEPPGPLLLDPAVLAQALAAQRKRLEQREREQREREQWDELERRRLHFAGLRREADPAGGPAEAEA